MVNASSLIEGAFVVLPVLVIALLLAGLWYAAVAPAHRESSRVTRRAFLAATVALVWLAVTAALARAGRLTVSSFPPTLMLAVFTGAGLSLWLGFSSLGERMASALPLAALVGSQAFRLPLELAMHRAMEEGLMPVQMSYSGLNFDIVTGSTALFLGAALLIRQVPSGWVHAWNGLGFLLLVNVVTIAILSTPLFRVFTAEPANTWIESFPYVWLPAVLVPAALLGHVLVWRHLRLNAVRRAVVR